MAMIDGSLVRRNSVSHIFCPGMTRNFGSSFKVSFPGAAAMASRSGFQAARACSSVSEWKSICTLTVSPSCRVMVSPQFGLKSRSA